MKSWLIIMLLAGCVIGGAVLATLITMTAWNIQIEPKAFQCTDSMWPFSTYWEDMDAHAGAGDKLSPGWTWKKLKVVRTIYIAAFFSIWAASAMIPFRIILRMLR